MAVHARLGPSSSSRWRSCTASAAAQDGLTDDGNDSSRQGTAEHQVGSECLEDFAVQPESYLGRTFAFLPDRKEMWLDDVPDDQRFNVMHTVELDDEAVQRVEVYVKFVRQLVALTGGSLLVERRVPIDHITGEAGAGGTADAILMCGDELIVIDYKSGQGRVDAYEVVTPEAVDLITGAPTPAVLEPNSQLAMYASGALREYGWLGNFNRVRMVIVQPRLNATPEYSVSVDDLNAFIEKLRIAAEETRTSPRYVPSSDNCNFCKARMTCKARESMVLTTVLEGFTEGDAQSLADAQPKAAGDAWLGELYQKLDVIQQWCKDVHARVYRALEAGLPVVTAQGVPFKLVEGRAGNRKWDDEAVVAATLLNMGVPDDRAFEKSLVSPATVEKLTKAKRGKKGAPGEPALLSLAQWEQLQANIKQEPGKPAISLASDPKPAMTPSIDGFTDNPST